MYICYQTTFCVIDKTVSVIIIINLYRIATSVPFPDIHRATVAALSTVLKAAEGQKWRTQK